MNETPDLRDVPEPIVTRPRWGQLSIVWLIPLVAALVGAWLAYKAISEKGPEITIRFDSGSGLEAGRTKIKYKDVDLGTVRKISLSDDRSAVIVQAQLDKQAESMLSPNSRFWVVEARVNPAGVSGLGTLFSGAFIAMDPGEPGAITTHFKGLKTPPIVTSDEPGRLWRLKADQRGSLEVGSPVYYRQMRVGEVVALQLNESGQRVDLEIFIKAPYHEFVYDNTRFWNVSGLDLALSAQGVRIKAESLTSLLIGGIAYNIPAEESPGEPAAPDTSFRLYASEDESIEKGADITTRWLLNFDGTVRGLATGAPVEFRGIPIGRVVDVNLDFDREQMAFEIPIVIEIRPERFIATAKALKANGAQSVSTQLDQIMTALVDKGLRARLKTGNLLTGQLFVELDIFPDAPAQAIIWDECHPQLPTLPREIEALTQQAERIIHQIGSIPIAKIARDLEGTVANLRQISGSIQLDGIQGALEASLAELQALLTGLRQEAVPEFYQTLTQARASLEAVAMAVGNDSALQQRLAGTLTEIANAARSLKVLTDYLERHPESIVYGKKEPK